MKKFYSRTYQAGKISVSFVYDELIIVIRRRNGVTLRKIRKPSFPYMKQIVVSAVTLVLLTFVVNGLVHSDSRDNDIEGTDITGDKEKNRILMSRETEYTAPAKMAPLVIRIHRVRKGETLSHIAQHYGVSMDTICGSNRLASSVLFVVYSQTPNLVSNNARCGIQFSGSGGNLAVASLESAED